MKKINLLFYCFFVATFSVITINSMEQQNPTPSYDYSKMSKAELIEKIKALKTMLEDKKLKKQHEIRREPIKTNEIPW